jgi:hypothetical protein
LPTPIASGRRDERKDAGTREDSVGATSLLIPKGVETHIRGAFAKLGIKDAPEDNRRVLAVLAYLRR